jgi:suppressor of fused
MSKDNQPDKINGDNDDSAPGWEAIDNALAPIYHDQEPFHYAAVIPMMLGGDDPLNGISAYRRDLPIPHWHFVTYGFTELYQKENNDPTYSGFGFELTFRLAINDKNESTPPTWALNFLQNLARYVFSSGNIFADGDHMNANGPIALDTQTKICALAFATDPELPAIDTPNGKVDFIQIVGLTLDEYQTIMRWNTRGMLATLKDKLPLLITDLTRESVLLDMKIAELIEAGIKRDGSTTGVLFSSVLEWQTITDGNNELMQVEIGANAVSSLISVIKGRIEHQRKLTLAGKNQAVCFRPAATNSWQLEDNSLIINMTPEFLLEFTNNLKPLAGSYQFSSANNLSITVSKTYIKDSNGKVVEVIG